MKLTAQAARELQPGAVLKDHVIRGLELRARAHVKTWCLYYRAPSGAQRRPKLGEFPAINLDTARELAKELLQRVARGEDPSAAKQDYRAAPTVADLCELYLASDRFLRTKLRTQDECRRHIRLQIIPLLGSLKAQDVQTRDVDRALRKIATGFADRAPAPIGANRVRNTLSAIFRLAEHPDHAIRPRHSNPVRDSFISPEHLRDTKLEPAHLPKIAAELDRLQAEWPARVAAIRVALLAGTRITELVTAKRSDLRGDRLVLREHKTQRTGEPRVIVLPRQALDILDTLPDDGSGYLFGRELNRYKVFHVWERVRNAAGCPNVQARDLRRTFASAAKSSGHGLDLVGELFGHKDPKTTRRYAWLFAEAAADAAQSVADELSRRMAPQTPEI